MTSRSPERPCGRGRCKRSLFTVQITKTRGAPVEEELDAVPSTWADGARIKLLISDHLPDGVQLAEKLTQAQIGRAFAVRHLYVPHADRCSAQKRKTGKSKRDRGTHD